MLTAFLANQRRLLIIFDNCAFDILFTSESKIDGTVSSCLFAYSQYRDIRRDRRKGGGRVLVYIRSNVTAYRRPNLCGATIGVESICFPGFV